MAVLTSKRADECDECGRRMTAKGHFDDLLCECGHRMTYLEYLARQQRREAAAKLRNGKP